VQPKKGKAEGEKAPRKREVKANDKTEGKTAKADRKTNKLPDESKVVGVIAQ